MTADELTEARFIEEVLETLPKARRKFPHPNPTQAAMSEEAGELVRAMLHIRDGKSSDWKTVWDEAVQLMTQNSTSSTNCSNRWLWMPMVDDMKRCPVTTFECLTCDIVCQLANGNDRRADGSGLDDGPYLPGCAPRKKPEPKSTDEIREIRRRAWNTRRGKYGPHGHR